MTKRESAVNRLTCMCTEHAVSVYSVHEGVLVCIQVCKYFIIIQALPELCNDRLHAAD